MAKNTTVEWTKGIVQSKTKENFNLLTTSYDQDQDPIMSLMAIKYSSRGYQFLDITHNHPNGNNIPSGLKNGETDGDIPFAKFVNNTLGNTSTFHIYTSYNSKYTEYYTNSEENDFYNNSLPELFVGPTF